MIGYLLAQANGGHSYRFVQHLYVNICVCSVNIHKTILPLKELYQVKNIDLAQRILVCSKENYKVF